jgi:triacylglycerol esterase/lipase EstA (alpha/beta hydrolase family)
MMKRAVLIHGLGRSSRSMRPIERRLSAGGYDVLNIDYASRSADVRALAAVVAEQIRAYAAGEPLNFVTHSLGGILLRAAVANNFLTPADVARVVMLGPPNRSIDYSPDLQVFSWGRAKVASQAHFLRSHS